MIAIAQKLQTENHKQQTINKKPVLGRTGWYHGLNL